MDLTCSAPEASSAMRGSAQLWRKLLVPDLASTGFILTLFLCLLLFDGTTTLFRDADSGWHIRIGEQILATGTVPNIDPFSFSREGQPWFAWEWLADVAMAIAHKSAGLAGVALLYSLAIGACTWLWFRLNWTVGGNFFLTAILAALMLSTSNLHWLARPHVFSWLLLLGLLIFCETAKPKWNWTEAAALALCGILWANIHASFFLGSLLLVLYGIGRWTASFLWPHAIHQARYGKKFFSLSAILLLSSV
ncbi:MAG TPA: hypothetical protein VE621_18800, partial [Bryobacteraceae bacterium]|nr:hypothetical protein [Bryobacteraceae bacterium]